MYSELQLERIQETLAALERRIGERFPGSGLGRVAAELGQLSGTTGLVLERLRRPLWALRISAGVGIAAILGLALWLAIVGRHLSPRVAGLADWLQGTESALNDIIIVGLAILFFVSLETRVKRRIALRALHRLRSIVHIVDMHQLTKDPEPLLTPQTATDSSPQRVLSRFELARYLDYCSELLSLASKLAALHVQHLNDPVVLNAVNDVEVLAANLSSKIWQKIMILDITTPQEVPAPSRADSERR